MARVRLGAGLMAGLVLLTLSGCPKDPYDAKTWIDKLDDPNPKKAKEALDKLDELKDAQAIEPLGKLWRKHSHSSQVLRVILDIAEHPKDKDGKDLPPNWKDAVPILEEAVSGFEIGDNRSVEDAMAAADALGRAGDPSAVETLIGAVNKNIGGKPIPVTDTAQNVRIAAMRALGNFGSDDRGVQTLIQVLQTDPLTEDNRNNPQAQRYAALIRGAAADALGASRNPKALQPLLVALFQVEMIFPQVRGALTQLGDVAVPELMKVFKGDHPEVNKLAKQYKFANDCSTNQGPGTECVAPGALEYKSAIVLGDLRAKKAVPMLVAALKKPAKTSFFAANGAPGPPDHNGILDALRKIGQSSAADDVLTLAKDPKIDDVFERPIAIDVYSMLTRDTGGLDYLGKLMKDSSAEEEVRRSAALGYARLVRTKDQVGPIDHLIELQEREAKKHEDRAKKAKKQEDKDDELNQADNFHALATLFWQHKVRALVGIECKDDVKCYVNYLKMTPAQVISHLKIPGADKLKKEGRAAYQIAAQERALLELAKMGQKGREALPELLRLADSTEGLIRDGVLLAMVQVAPKPCDECTKRLDEVIAAQKGQDRLSRLTADTGVVRNYFVGGSNRGGK